MWRGGEKKGENGKVENQTVTEDSAGVADDVPAGQGFTFVDLFAG